MYARLITFSGADPEKRDPTVETVKETVIPMLKTYDGFAGYFAFYDADKSRATAIILWDTKDAAEAAEETLVERRAQISGRMGLQVESADLYEAPVIELVGAPV
jgi:gamma-glutamyl phosphate reductase